MVGVSSIPARCLKNTKLPVDLYMKNSLASRTTMTDMALAIGIERSTLIRWMRKNGYPVLTRKEGQRIYLSVTVDGITATKKEHCQRIGFSPEYVRKVMADNGLTWLEAFSVCSAKRERKGEPLASDASRRACIRAGVHIKSVERRMRIHKIGFEQALAMVVSNKQKYRSKK